MKRFFSGLLCFLFLISFFSPLYEVKADSSVSNNTLVTFGVTDTNQTIVESSEVTFRDSYSYGLCSSLYNYFYNTYHENSYFPSSVDVMVSQFETLFPMGFFDALATNGWLMNAYGSNFSSPNANLYLVFSRNAYNQDTAEIVAETSLDGGMDLNFLPDVNSSVNFVGLSSPGYYYSYSYAPYFSIHVSDSEWTENKFSFTFRNSSTDLNDFVSGLSALDIRSFMININYSLPSLSFWFPNTDLGEPNYLTYLNSSTAAIGIGCIFTKVLVSQYPIYYLNSGQPFFSNSQGTFLKPQDISNGFVYNSNFDFPILNLYESMDPVPSPSPFPTITLMPSVTPIPPVDPVQGLGQMFTLFTRKYDFNFNGVTIGIRPLQLFLATFFIGMIFRAIQGGNSE